MGSCGCHVHPVKCAFPHPCTVLPLRSLESTILTATLQCTMPLCAWLRYVEGVPCAVKGHCTAMHVWAFYWLLVGSSRSPIIMRNVIFGHSFIITLGQCITLLRMPSPVSPWLIDLISGSVKQHADRALQQVVIWSISLQLAVSLYLLIPWIPLSLRQSNLTPLGRRNSQSLQAQ